MAAAAPFLAGSLLKLGTGSTTVTPLFRSGKNRLQAELLDLARSAGGVSAGLRLWINKDRQLVVDQRPLSSVVDLSINAAGEVRHPRGVLWWVVKIR